MALEHEWRWNGFRTLVIEGTTWPMPVTAENQAEYPQSSSQAEGLGFPILRAVALTSLATGMVLALTTGPCAGKETGEMALFRTLFDTLKAGDLLLSDRCAVGQKPWRLVPAGAASTTGGRVRDSPAPTPDRGLDRKSVV